MGTYFRQSNGLLLDTRLCLIVHDTTRLDWMRSLRFKSIRSGFSFHIFFLERRAELGFFVWVIWIFDMDGLRGGLECAVMWIQYPMSEVLQFFLLLVLFSRLS